MSCRCSALLCCHLEIVSPDLLQDFWDSTDYPNAFLMLWTGSKHKKAWQMENHPCQTDTLFVLTPRLTENYIILQAGNLLKVLFVLW